MTANVSAPMPRSRLLIAGVAASRSIRGVAAQ